MTMKKSFLILLAFLCLNHLASAQQSVGLLNSLVEQTMQTNTDHDDFVLAWWIPLEFWDAAQENDPTITDEVKDQIKKMLGPYNLVGFFDGQMADSGVLTSISVKEISKSIELKGNDGNSYRPIDHKDLPAEMQEILGVFKPIFKNLLGPLGESIHIYVFSDESKKGGRVADPIAEGTVAVSPSGRKFTWPTPISCLLPPMKCPVDDKTMDGSWKYCPWHGEELIGE